MDRAQLDHILAQLKKLNAVAVKVDNAENKSKKVFHWIRIALIVIGVIAIAAAIIYGVYKFMQPDYYEDYDDDVYDDDYEEENV